MAKIKIRSRYGTIPNELLNNKNITFKAKGLYGYLQSKPDDWDFSADRIKFDTKESRDAILSGLKELEEYGYLVRERTQNEKGFWEIEYILYENPTQDNPKLENPTQDNPTINKERNTKKEINKKEVILKQNFKSLFDENIGRNQDFIDRIIEKFAFSGDELKSIAENFCLYWTEKNHNGKKERWEMQKTFDIQRRFYTWLNNQKSFGRKNKGELKSYESVF